MAPSPRWRSRHESETPCGFCTSRTECLVSNVTEGGKAPPTTRSHIYVFQYLPLLRSSSRFTLSTGPTVTTWALSGLSLLWSQLILLSRSFIWQLSIMFSTVSSHFLTNQWVNFWKTQAVLDAFVSPTAKSMRPWTQHTLDKWLFYSLSKYVSTAHCVSATQNPCPHGVHNLVVIGMEEDG